MTTDSSFGAWVRTYAHDRYLGWRSASRRSQLFAVAMLGGGVTVSFAVSLWNYSYMPLTAYFVWLLLGMMLLRFVPLLALCTYAATAAVTAMVIDVDPISSGRIMALSAMAIVVGLILYQSSQQRSGLPVPLSEALLADLRDRLLALGSVPALPGGWHSTSAMIAANGVGYAGDFLVAVLDEDESELEMVLVDVCGKGVAAGAAALHFAGALGGLIGATSQPQLFQAANAFLLRQDNQESFATAVHVRLRLDTGEYAVTSAGHPPALHWDGLEWVVDNARGTALGILPEPELVISHGSLAPGEALLFYTDGVIESRKGDLDDGVAWLQAEALRSIRPGYDGAAQRIIRGIERGDDDRAVLILSRGTQPARRTPARA